ETQCMACVVRSRAREARQGQGHGPTGAQAQARGVAAMSDSLLHGDSDTRKTAPICEGALWYFPDAIRETADLMQHLSCDVLRNTSITDVQCDVRGSDEESIEYMTDIAAASLYRLQCEVGVEPDEIGRAHV